MAYNTWIGKECKTEKKIFFFPSGVKRPEYKREKKKRFSWNTQRDIKKPHDTQKIGEEAAQNKGENRYKTGDKKQRK